MHPLVLGLGCIAGNTAGGLERFLPTVAHQAHLEMPARGSQVDFCSVGMSFVLQLNPRLTGDTNQTRDSGVGTGTV